MKIELLNLVYRAQDKFRFRLFLVRQNQLELARQKREDAEANWRLKLAEWSAWKKICNQATCDGCERLRSRCCCHRRATPTELVSMIRHLAGINPSQGVTRYIHDEDKSSGPVGYRVCGQNSWDNAVREWDENR